MRISDRYQSTIERVAPAKPVQATTKSAATESTGDAASGILDIHVSAQAQALSNRAAGLEQLKARIQNGTFQIDHDAIAAKLVGE
jgi:anti-sigma28 factor (negative regulator of flagellin synthesis)